MTALMTACNRLNIDRSVSNALCDEIDRLMTALVHARGAVGALYARTGLAALAQLQGELEEAINGGKNRWLTRS